LVEQAAPQLVGWVQFLGHTKDFKSGKCGLSNAVLYIDVWVQRNSSCVALPLTHDLYSIQCERSHLGHSTSKRIWCASRQI